MPEKKTVRIVGMKPNKNYVGESDYIYGKNDEIIGQTIAIPMKRGKINSEDIPTCFHEFVHVLDTLFNPKFVARSNKMFMNEQYDNFYDRCFDVLYHHETCKTKQEKEVVLNKAKESIYKALSGRSRNEKIDLVQELRNEMKTEWNAYKAETKYANKLNSSGVKVNSSDLDDYNDGYMFEEKFNLLTQVGKELVANERKRNASIIQRNRR